ASDSSESDSDSPSFDCLNFTSASRMLVQSAILSSFSATRMYRAAVLRWMSGQCSFSQRSHLPLGLVERTFSLARQRALPHLMACLRASLSALRTSLCSSLISPTKVRALSLDIGLLSGAVGPRRWVDFTMRYSGRWSATDD